MRLKIHGGTANHSESSLCLTCRFATIVKGRTLRDVTFCTSYADKQLASIREMEDIAWVLRSDPRRNEVGFVPAGKLKPQDRYVLPDELD